MLSRTIVVDTSHVHPVAADLKAAVDEFKRQVTAEGKTLDGEPDATLLSHHVGQSMTFNVKCKTAPDAKAADKPAEKPTNARS